MTKLFLINPGYPFQSGQAEGEGIFLQKRWYIVFKYKIGFFKRLAATLDELFHLLVARLKVLHSLLDSSSGTNNTIRIVFVLYINGELPVSTSFNNSHFTHNE